MANAECEDLRGSPEGARRYPKMNPPMIYNAAQEACLPRKRNRFN